MPGYWRKRDPFVPVSAGVVLDDAATTGNHRSIPVDPIRGQRVPLLTRSLTIPFRLVGIDLAHLFQELTGIGPRNIRRSRAVSLAALFWPKWNRRFLDAFRHGKTLRENPPNFKGSRNGGLRTADYNKSRRLTCSGTALNLRSGVDKNAAPNDVRIVCAARLV